MRQPSRLAHASGMPTRSKWVLAGFIAIALLFLLTQHRAYLFGIRPYLPVRLVLVAMCVHQAHREEQDAIEAFGDAYRQYMREVPAFFPRLGRPIPPPEIGSRERHG